MTTPRAGDVDYETRGLSYTRQRQTDPRIARWIVEALGSAGTVLNVGAGAGSYEPRDGRVIALDPSPAMLAQRPLGAAPAVRGRTEELPFGQAVFDASMALVTVHQLRCV